MLQYDWKTAPTVIPLGDLFNNFGTLCFLSKNPATVPVNVRVVAKQ